MPKDSKNNFWERITNKEKLKKEFIEISYFISLYENFKSNWEDVLLGFYANHISFDKNDENAMYEFTMLNPNNPNAFNESDYIKDQDSEEKYKKEVYRTVKKANGKDWDHEASMFNWLLRNGIIEQPHYNNLLRIRILRNKLVHELDQLLYKGLPEDLPILLKELIEIRKFSSKQWFIQFELPTSGVEKYDEKGNIIIPETVLSSPDLMYDIIYEIVLNQ